MKRTTIFLLVIGFLTLAALCFSLTAGAVHIPFSQILKWLTGTVLDHQSQTILTELRAPRTIASFCVGASLGLSGLVLQTLLKNPLAEPYTLGLSGGSSVGAIIALATNMAPMAIWVPAFSTVGCLLALALVLMFARKRLGFESRSLILFGVMISLFFNALVVFSLTFIPEQRTQTFLYWLMGEFGTNRDVWSYTLFPVQLLFAVLIYFKSESLEALSLGSVRAQSLGFSPKRERAILIVVAALLTSTSVAVSGLVGFVGLVSPHIARYFLKTSKFKFLTPVTFLLGGSLLCLADSFGRVLGGSREIPAGSLAALFGAPILVLILMRGKNAQAE